MAKLLEENTESTVEGEALQLEGDVEGFDPGEFFLRT